MGLYGGWWGVGLVVLLILLLIREVLKWMRGEVDLSARQKVLRVIGGGSLIGVAVMILYSPVLLAMRPDGSRMATATQALIYLSVAAALCLIAMLMAVLDFIEVTRRFSEARRNLQKRMVTQEDIDRLIREHQRDHPEDVGRPRKDDDT